LVAGWSFLSSLNQSFKTIPMATKKISPLMRKYNAIKKTKSKNCAGKATAADVKKKAKAYIDAAVNKGQTRTEATRKANAITNRSCKTASIGKTRRRKR
jgi:hypothetical protein